MTTRFLRSKIEYEVAEALRRGTLVRPDTCSQCGIMAGALNAGGRAVKIEGHHADYSKPLAVVWLCKTCHGRTRRKPDSDKRKLIRIPTDVHLALKRQSTETGRSIGDIISDWVRAWFKRGKK